MRNKILQGDALEVLKTLPDESVDMCLTSPPYWALRDYGVEGQLGLEPTFQEYIDKLCDIFDEVKRVLKKEGTCWVNMGDTYGQSGGAGSQYGKHRMETLGMKKYGGHNVDGMSKCLLQIPSRFAIEMCNRGWILRNEIIWYKPNCMPSSVKDRFTVDFEKLFFFVKSKKYWFETQYEPYTKDINRWGGNYKRRALNEKIDPAKKANANSLARADRDMRPNEEGKNKRCVWTITTKPYKEAHFAVYPPKLCETPIKAGCPEFVCKKCGEARERIAEIKTSYDESKYDRNGDGIILGRKSHPHGGLSSNWESPKITNKGLTDCGCNAGWDKGIVLDPFFGAGTTGLVAKQLGRDYLGIELNPEYIKIAEKRLSQRVLL